MKVLTGQYSGPGRRTYPVSFQADGIEVAERGGISTKGTDARCER